MPPIDWSIIQSLLLTLILPACTAAAGVMAIVCATTRSETGRSVGASLAFVAGLAAGNFRGELVPFSAIHRTVNTSDPNEGIAGRSLMSAWEIETGWYSLFSVALIAILADILIDLLLRRRLHLRWAATASGILAVVCASWLTPWDQLSIRPWVAGLLAAAILLNATTLRLVGQQQRGHIVPLILAVVWGGCVATVLVLAHSARFADLAIVLSSSLGGVGLLIFLMRHRASSLYSGPATFVPGLMLGGALNTYSEIPAACFALAAIAPGLLVFLRSGKLRDWFESRPIALVVAFLVPCVLAVGLAMRAEL